MSEGPTLYERFVAAGLETDSHESDLYVKSSPEAREILKDFPLHAKNARPFRSNIDGKTWLDVPFAYTPYWDRRTGRVQETGRSHSLALKPIMPPGTTKG
jgi:hypothetical protein